MRAPIKNRLNSFYYAFKGIADLYKNHANARIHLFFTLTILLLSYYFSLSTIEFCIIIICISMVTAAEAFNSAIEYLADKTESNPDPLIAKAKDISAAAVLICAIGSAVIGLIIFFPKLMLLVEN